MPAWAATSVNAKGLIGGAVRLKKNHTCRFIGKFTTSPSLQNSNEKFFQASFLDHSCSVEAEWSPLLNDTVMWTSWRIIYRGSSGLDLPQPECTQCSQKILTAARRHSQNAAGIKYDSGYVESKPEPSLHPKIRIFHYLITPATLSPNSVRNRLPS